jgi:butyryl-CoA dehydrogenase
MGFGLNEEQELIRTSIREFMAGECPREAAHELDEADEFPQGLLQKLADLGFCGLCVPEELGGAGRNLLSAAIVVEEIAALSPALASGFFSIALRGGAVLAELGSDEQKTSLLPRIADGSLLVTHALQATGIAATPDGDDWLLAGSQPFVSLGARADFLLARARTTALGCRGTGFETLRFEQVRLTAADVLGGRGRLHQGAKQARFLRAVDRLGVAAAGVGIAQGAFDYAADYARQRVQFSRPIADFEAIQQKFAQLAGAIRADRLLLYEACWRADRRQAFELEAAMAASRATSLARRAALEAIQILGGQGYMLESDAQRSLRDALVLLTGAERDSQLQCTVGALLGIGNSPEWT